MLLLHNLSLTKATQFENSENIYVDERFYSRVSDDAHANGQPSPHAATQPGSSSTEGVTVQSHLGRYTLHFCCLLVAAYASLASLES